MSNLAIKSLLKERKRLMCEKDEMLEQYNSSISEIETAIESITGEKFSEVESKELYDDEHPDYIKGSIEN